MSIFQELVRARHALNAYDEHHNVRKISSCGYIMYRSPTYIMIDIRLCRPWQHVAVFILYHSFGFCLRRRHGTVFHEFTDSCFRAHGSWPREGAQPRSQVWSKALGFSRGILFLDHEPRAMNFAEPGPIIHRID